MKLATVAEVKGFISRRATKKVVAAWQSQFPYLLTAECERQEEGALDISCIS
jgi:hypothetical protein